MYMVSDDILARTDVKGFPIISTDGRRILMGFIERTDLRYILGELLFPTLYVPLLITVCHVSDKARKVQDVRPNTPVSFASDSEDHEEVELSGIAAGPAVGIDEDISMEIMETTATPDVLKMWPWVNQV